jgi:hypothetical protein
MNRKLEEPKDLNPPDEWFDEVRKRAEEQGVTHQCIEACAPRTAATALWMKAQGVSNKQVSRRTGLSYGAINGLCWRHADTLETKRKEFSQKYAIAAQTFTDLLFDKAEQLADNPDQLINISPDKLALTVGIMTDKAAQLSGMAGVVIEHRKGASISDAAKVISEAKARIAAKLRDGAIDAEIISA